MTSDTRQPEAGERKPLLNRQYCILFFINLMISLTLFMTNTYMAQHLSGVGISLTSAGAIIGAMSIASMAIRPLSGWLCDSFNRKLLLIVFTGVIAAVMLGYGLARSAAIFYLLRILHGAAFSMTTTITMAFVVDFIPQNRVGEGLGYFGLGQSIAAAIGPSAGIAIAARFGSPSIFFAAFAVVFVSFCLAFAVKRVPTDDTASVRILRKIKLSDFFAKEAIPYAVITVALSAANGIETAYIAGYAQSFSIGNIGWYFTLSAAALFAARLLFGRLTDKKGFSYVLYPGMTLIIAALVTLSFVNTENAAVMFAVSAVIKALGVGALQPGIQAMCLQSVGASRRGAASSTYYIGADLGQGLSAMIAGGLIFTMGYAAMFRLYTLPLLLVLVFYFLLTLLKKRPESGEQT